MPTHEELREKLDAVLSGRGYDNWPAEEELYEEMLDELVDVVKTFNLLNG